MQRWRALAEQSDPHITADPYWPRLATHLDAAARAGADVAELLREAIECNGPLPDELPAAALWWRVAGRLSPPTLDQPNVRLRPPWTAELPRLLGNGIADAVVADSAWPSLVAAVAASGWSPREALAAAHEHLKDISYTEQLRPDEYARLLAYRIELLTHRAATVDVGVPAPMTEPPDITDEPPPDMEHYPYGFAEDDSNAVESDAYDVDAELPKLADEVEILEAATARSPAAMYTAPDDALEDLDDGTRNAVTAIAGSAQAVQVLELHEGADKASALRAISEAVHHSGRRILAVPASKVGLTYAREHRYADTTTDADTARSNIENGSWRIPLGSLIVVDDADQLDADDLRFLAKHASAVNSKVLVILGEADRRPQDTLVTVLADNLPWAQRLGQHTQCTKARDSAITRAARHHASSYIDPRMGEQLERLDKLLRDNRYRAIGIDIDSNYGLGRDQSLEL